MPENGTARRDFRRVLALAALMAGTIAGNAAAQQTPTQTLAATIAAASTPAATLAAPEPAPPLAIVGATVITVTRGVIPNGTLLVRDGKIAALGVGLNIPHDATVIDAKGKYLMPGIIDTHSHMGVYGWPNTHAHDDGNEMTDPITPHLLAEDSLYLEDPAFERARAGGVTTVQIIPGSGNLQGGQSVVVKLRPVNTLDEMKFAGAPRGIKMAFGENPKRVYGSKGREPSTRMGNAAVLREAFSSAVEYEKQWADYEANAKAGKPTVRPEKNARLDVLLDVLKGRVRVHWHCYRKDDLLALMRISDEFGFKIASFQHGLEAYKLAREIARRGIGVATWPDWWGFKMEAWDAIPQSPGILAQAGVKVSLHSDSSDLVQRLFTEGAKAVRYGMQPLDALKAITIWPAAILGVDERVGSLEVGKDADLAVFNKHPFDVYTTVDKTIVDGRIVHDAATDKEKP